MVDVTLKGAAAICGLGITPMGEVQGRDALDFAVEAIDLALVDAGLSRSELDGVMFCPGFAQNPVSIQIQAALGIGDLRLLSQVFAFGSSAGVMVQYAALAVHHGLANYVACVFADNPLQAGTATANPGVVGAARPTGMRSLNAGYGVVGALTVYAMTAQRHMDLYGTTHDQLGAVAVATRAWGAMNPIAQIRKPIDIKEYRELPFLCEPFRAPDCCVVSNGGVCVIVTTPERARGLRQPPVYLWGFGQSHQSDLQRSERDAATNGPGRESAKAAFAMAGAGVADVTQCQIYDCYSATTIVTLEDYGFCAKGEGGPFVEDGRLGPGGALPTNTGGGQLSGYYMWGYTPLSEAVIQGRGQGGARQATNDLIVVSGTGGLYTHGSTLILSPHPS